MNQFPIDTAVFDQGIVMVVGCEPVVDYDSGVQKTDRENVPKWKLQVLYRANGARRPEVVEVGFATATQPEFDAESRPVFKGLVGRLWSNENQYGHSAGVAISAEQVGFRNAPSTERGGERVAA